MKRKKLNQKNTTKWYHPLYVPIPVSFADDRPHSMRAAATAGEECQIAITTVEPREEA
jgi:hypothetical protein